MSLNEEPQIEQNIRSGSVPTTTRSSSKMVFNSSERNQIGLGNILQRILRYVQLRESKQQAKIVLQQLQNIQTNHYDHLL